MAIHPSFPTSPYAELDPNFRWFPADEALRESAYDKLLLRILLVKCSGLRHEPGITPGVDDYALC